MEGASSFPKSYHAAPIRPSSEVVPYRENENSFAILRSSGYFLDRASIPETLRATTNEGCIVKTMFTDRRRGAAIGLMLFLWTATPAVGAESELVKKANYKQAFKYSADYLRQFVYDTTVTPHWIGDSDCFWYSYRTRQGANWYRVDAAKGTKEPLFDRVKLAARLSEALHKPLDPMALTLDRASVNSEGKKLTFVVDATRYEYDLKADKLAKLGAAPPAPPNRPGLGARGNFRRQDGGGRQGGQRRQDAASSSRDHRNFAPDGKVFVFAKRHNLYLAEAGKENEAVQLSTDGIEDFSFGGGDDDRKVHAAVTWSKDSTVFYVLRRDMRGVKELYVVNSLAEPRPTLEKYKYPMPGEDAIRKTELFLFSRDSNTLTRIEPKWRDESYSDLHWNKDSTELRFVRRDRLQRHIEFCTLNLASGKAKCLLAEGFDNAGIIVQPARYLDDTKEMIWWSERSGWAHFYLYDRDGKLKNAITSGCFRASRIEAVDAKNRVLYFHGNGREAGENVYYQHLYRVNLDGSGLALLDPGDAEHQSSLSPSRKFAVDNWSRVDREPISFLRDANGKQIMELERADLSRLYEVGWKMPETFVVKAADGVTDLYGNMWKPFDFDPKKKYPIIAHVYPGPQQEGVTHTFSAISTNQELAQLGFIVVQVGHRGGAPTRSKAYASYGYFNLRDYGLADKKSAIEQLAARHSFIDLDRVGIYGHSGGGFMSAAAMMQKPYNEFFKAAVASSGNHDNNIYNDNWAERYHGLREAASNGTSAAARNGNGASADDGDKKDQGQIKDDSAAQKDTRFEIKVPTNAELAANLKGHLLLVHGEIDNNVHPANTMRLVDALIKANKRFDMLMIPGKRHGYADYQPYFRQRMWDFFAEHLLHDRQTGADIYEKRP
jgi:dipeptidyl-peptidase-4